MNKKEHKNFKRSWALTVAGFGVAYFLSVSAAGFYDVMKSPSWRASGICIFFGFFAFILIDFLSYFIFNINELKNCTDFEIIKLWHKSKSRKK